MKFNILFNMFLWTFISIIFIFTIHASFICMCNIIAWLDRREENKKERKRKKMEEEETDEEKFHRETAEMNKMVREIIEYEKSGGNTRSRNRSSVNDDYTPNRQENSDEDYYRSHEKIVLNELKRRMESIEDYAKSSSLDPLNVWSENSYK